MHEQQPEQERDTGRERPALQPRIYVASLADYAGGRLYGGWLDAARSEPELRDDIEQLLANAPTPGAEEWLIHDSEDFAGLQIDAGTDLAIVSNVANGLTRHGEAFAVYAEVVGVEHVDVGSFEQAYRGTFDSTTAYVEQLLDDLGAEHYLAEVPDWLKPYVRIDAAGLARDLELGGDIYVAAVNDGVAVFDAHG